MRASSRLGWIGLIAGFCLVLGDIPEGRAAEADSAAALAVKVQSELNAAKAGMLHDPQSVAQIALEAERHAQTLPPGRERTIAVATARWLRIESYIRTGGDLRVRPLTLATLKSLQGIDGPLKVRADLLLSLGWIQLDRVESAAALASFQRAYKIFQQLGERRSQSITLQHIASLYTIANDFNRSEQYYRQAADVYAGDDAALLSLRNNRANVLVKIGRKKEAEEEYRKAIEIARKIGNQATVARILANLAGLQIDNGNRLYAKKSIATGLSIIENQPDREVRRRLLAVSARLAQIEGNSDKATELIGRSFQGLDLTGTPVSLLESHQSAYEIYKSAHDPEKALAHLEAVRRLTDEANKVTSSASAALMAARFDYANQEARIARLRAEELKRTIAFEKSRTRFQRTLFQSLGAAALAILALLTFALLTIRRSRDQVRAANTDLEATNDALEKALRAKTEFLATTSHEIRTPLNGILGMTQVMLADPKLRVDLRDRIGVVHGAGVTMRALVDDILDLAKMETGNLTVEAAPLDLRATLVDVTRLWEEQARGKGLGFTLDLGDVPQWIEGDSARLRQISFNLLSNAIKFTAHGTVGLSARVVPDAPSPLFELAVRDSGIGIPQDKQSEIFESFRQADAGTTRRFGGTGLGLTICRNLAQAMGGDIRVESVEGEGATFVVTLPLVKIAAPGATGCEAAAATGDALLIVDANPITRSMVKAMLAPHHPSLCMAASLDEAIALLARGGVARIVVDDGILSGHGAPASDVLGRLRESSSESAQIILLCGEIETAERDAESMPTIRRVAKPVNGAALRQALGMTASKISINPPKSPLVSQAA